VSDLSDAVGVAVLVDSLATVGMSVVLLRGRLRPSRVLEALAQVALLPGRRRRFLQLLMLEAGFFVVIGILLGLDGLGIAFPIDPDFPLAAAFLGGMLMMGWISWTALRPQSLSSEERADLARNAPSILESLWMAPYREPPANPGERRTRRP
jgi:hypothetical protein